jgi:hopanoid biosynthesis associated RND transporter like protein HpnN
MRRRYLSGLADVIVRRPWWFLAIGIFVSILAAVYTWRSLEFKTSRNDLIGRDSEYWHLFSEYAREFKSEEDYIIVVESDQPSQNKATVNRLVAGLLAPDNNPHPLDAGDAQQFRADDVFYRVDFDKLKPWFLYYLSVEDLKQIRDSLSDFKQLVSILQHKPRLQTFFDSMNRMLGQMERTPVEQRGPMLAFIPTVTGIARNLGETTPREESSALLSPWASAFFSEQMVGEAEQQMKWQGYQTFRNGHMFILLIHPRGANENDVAPHNATIPKLRRILETVRQQSAGVTISLTGEPVLDYDEMLVSQRDATKATVLTLLLVALLFALSFKEVIRPVLAICTMVLVLAMSMGYATGTVGHLNIITVTFAVMILGLGIDLGIQFIARYEEELSKNVGREAALRCAIRDTGPSIITAGVTNAAAFFAMGLSGFRGVIELGAIAGGGMLIATVATMTVLPALLALVRRKRESTQIPARGAATKIEQFLVRRPGWILAVSASVTIVALIVGWRTRFDYNVLNLQSHGLESVDTELRLLNADVESTLFASIVCDNLDEARELQHSLTGLASVATVHSIAELIPEQQSQKAAIIRTIQVKIGEVHFEVPRPDRADAEGLVRSLASLRLSASRLARDAAERGDTQAGSVLRQLAETLRDTRRNLQALEPPEVLQDYLADYERRFYGDLEAQLNLMSAQIIDRPMSINDVPAEVRRMLVGKTNKLLVRVFPKENIWERDELVKFVREVQSVAPKVTGTPLGLFEFVELLKTGYRKAALWALLVITILIFIDFRGVAATVLTILPLLVGMAWMLGVMSLTGVPFNPANIMVLPLMVGIGVAYGIYVVQRFREDGEATFYSKSTGRAVVLSALTTIVAFGSMIIGAHRGIRSLGLVMIIGILACGMAALALLPAFLEIARRKRWKI